MMPHRNFDKLGFRPGDVVQCMGSISSYFVKGQQWLIQEDPDDPGFPRVRVCDGLWDDGWLADWELVRRAGDKSIEDDGFTTEHPHLVVTADDVARSYINKEALPKFPWKTFSVSVDAAPEPPTVDIKAEIADEAKRIVSGARRSAYGTPEQNFERIARFWTAYMANTGRDVEITAADVSPLMRLMKEARLCETPDHRDSHVDLVGYALTGAEVAGVKGAE